MSANGIANMAQFAEGVIGISRQRFNGWLYNPMDDVPARALLRCAEALNTNPEFLLGDTDDPRPATALELREHQLVEAYRVLSERDKDRLLRQASDWVAESESAPSAAAPFRTR